MKWKLFRVIPLIFCCFFFTKYLAGVDECVICTDPLDDDHGEVVCLDCDRDPDPTHPHHCHKFHRDCIQRALDADYQRKCPLCRAQNCMILSLPPTGLAAFLQPIKNQALQNFVLAKQRLQLMGSDIQQRFFANPHLSSLWQVRKAAFAGAASALVGVPCYQGAAAMGVVGAFKSNVTIKTAWYYPAAFTLGYVGALICSAVIKHGFCSLTAIPADASIVSSIPLVSVLSAAAFNLWRHS